MAENDIRQTLSELEALRQKLVETQAALVNISAAFDTLGDSEINHRGMGNFMTEMDRVANAQKKLLQDINQSPGPKGTNTVDVLTSRAEKLEARVDSLLRKLNRLTGVNVGGTVYQQAYEKLTPTIAGTGKSKGVSSDEDAKRIATTVAEYARLKVQVAQLRGDIDVKVIPDTMVNNVLKVKTLLKDSDGAVQQLVLSFDQFGNLTKKSAQDLERLRVAATQTAERVSNRQAHRPDTTTTIHGPDAGPELSEGATANAAKQLFKLDDIIQSVRTQLGKLGIDTATQEKIIADYSQQWAGVTGTFDEAAAASVTLSDGMVRVNGVLSDSSGAAVKASESYNKAGQAARYYGEESRKAFSPEQIRELQGRYEKAFQFVGNMGFQPENLKKLKEIPSGNELVPNTLMTFKNGIKEVTIAVDSLGRIVPEVSRRFRNFSQSVSRDFRELAKWTIAIGLIYGPINQLRQLTQTMIENESRLADVAIVLNNDLVSQGQAFDTIAQAAQSSATAINDATTAFTVAYRAVGDIANEEERYAQATTLLNDALTLSKLTGTGQAESVDTLSASLRQLGMGLDQGSVLLDKWVRVSKVANVDITTLATGFAVLGETAGAAGLDIDELNAVVAALTEATPYSGREAANSVRFLINAYQSQTAIDALSRYGVAVKTITGDVREFLSILEEMARVRSTVSDSEFNQLLSQVGGGSRGAAKLGALISNLGRVDQIRAQSFSASGDAADALAKKLDTVQSSLVQLANAGQSLAQSLGDEGGLLDLFKSLVDIGTSLISVLDKLFAAMGKAGPVLAGLGIARLALGNKEIQTARLNQLGVSLMTQFPGLMGGMGGATGPAGTYTSEGFQPSMGGNQRFNSEALSRAYFSNIGQWSAAVGITAIPAITNWNQGNKEEAVGNVGGAAAGAIISTLLTGSPIIGAAIGSAIGEAFVRTTISYKEPLSNILKPAFTTQEGEIKPPVSAETTPEQVLFNQNGPEWLNRFLANFKGNAEAQKEFNNYLSRGYTFTPTSLNNVKTSEMNKFDRERLLNFPIERIISMVGAGSTIGGTFNKPGEKPVEFATQPSRFRAQYESYTPEEQQKVRLQLAVKGEGTALEDAAKGIINTYKKSLEDLQKATLDALTKELITGKITPAEYGKQTSEMTGFPERATRFYAAGGEEFLKLSKDVDTVDQAFVAFALILSKGSQESNQYLTTFAEDINNLSSILQNLPEGQTAPVTTLAGNTVQMDRSAIERELGSRREQFGSLLTEIFKQTKLNQNPLPGVVGNINAPVSLDEYNRAVEAGIAIQEKYYRDVGKTTDEIEALIKALPEFAAAIEDGSGILFKVTTGLAQDMYQAGLESIGAASQSNIGFNQYQFTQAQILSAAAQANAMAASWETKFGYTPDYTDQVVVALDSVFKLSHTDSKIMQMLLEKLVDQGQKQLDGQYNIPEGATFWVPLTAAYYRYQGNGGSGFNDVIATNTGSAAETLNNMYQDMLAGKILTGYTESEKTNGTQEDIASKIADAVAAAFPNKGSPEDIQNRVADAVAAAFPSAAGTSESSPGGAYQYQPPTGTLNYGQTVTYFEEANKTSVIDTILNFFKDLIASATSINPGGKTLSEITNPTSPFSQQSLTPQLEPFPQQKHPEAQWGYMSQPPIGAGAAAEVVTGTGDIAEQIVTGLNGWSSEFISELTSSLDSFITKFNGIFNSDTGVKFSPRDNTGGVTPLPTTKLSLNLNSTTTLTLDGRAVATVVKAYLLEDLLRATSAYSSTTRSYVISG